MRAGETIPIEFNRAVEGFRFYGKRGVANTVKGWKN
jgi:hypothetical protein